MKICAVGAELFSCRQTDGQTRRS